MAGSYALPKLGAIGLDLAQQAARKLLGESNSPYVKTLGNVATSLIDTFGNDIGISQQRQPGRICTRYRSMSANPSQRKSKNISDDNDWQDQRVVNPQKSIQSNAYQQQF